MAKFEADLTGNLDHFKEYLKNEILNGSVSASFEDEHEEEINGVGGNRVSLNVTILGYEGELRLTAITSGGSQAMFFKLNTFGEEAFLEKLEEAVKAYKCRHTRMISGL